MGCFRNADEANKECDMQRLSTIQIAARKRSLNEGIRCDNRQRNKARDKMRTFKYSLGNFN